MCLIWVFCVLILGSECNEEILFQILFMLTKPSFNPLASAWVHFFVYFWRTTRVPAETPVATLGGRTTNKKTFHTESILKTLLSTLLRATGENNLFRLFQDTPPLDVERMTQTLKEKNVTASSLKFGFLGLGIMGSGMVKNLLNSGHKVIVWNRTTEKVSLSSSSFFFVFLVEFSMPIPLTICTFT